MLSEHATFLQLESLQHKIIAFYQTRSIAITY